MGRQSRLKRERRARREANEGTCGCRCPQCGSEMSDGAGLDGMFWDEADGVHSLLPAIPGVSPGEFAAKMTENLQKGMRESQIWDEMVEKCGEEEAERLLKECRFESRGQV